MSKTFEGNHMFPNFDSQLTLFAMKDVKNVVRIDSALPDAGEEYYCEDNIKLYFIVINLWLMLIAELSERAQFSLSLSIKRQGLISMIQRGCDASDQVINGLDVTDPVFRLLLVKDPQEPQFLRQLLLALRFPKRISPANCNGLEKRSLAAFQDVESSNRMKNRMFFSYKTHLLPQLRDILSPLGKHWSPRSGNYSNGVTTDSTEDIAHKLYATVVKDPMFLYPLCPPFPSDRYREYDFCSEVKFVPKSYKARRVIAEEESGRQYRLQGVRKGIWEDMQKTSYKYKRKHVAFSDMVRLEEQEWNQTLAYRGSLDGSYATIDMSNASDSIPATLVRSILPSSYLAEMEKWRPRYVVTPDGKRRTMQMWMTSGNACTFITESLVFLSIALLACEHAALWTGESFDPTCSVAVYGDDVIVPQFAAELCIQYLETLGFTVNESKSYCSLNENGIIFRESCGVEAVFGYDVSSQYFPRKFLEGKAGMLGSLLHLQHLFFAHWKMSTWLTELVQSLEPKMTFSRFGEPYADLWSDTELSELGTAPAAIIKAFPANGWSHVDTRMPWSYTKKFCTIPCDYYRELHFSTLAHFTKVGSCRGIPNPEANVLEEVYDSYCYLQFLENGPRFGSPLDKLLGVSERRLSFREACCRPQILWRKIKF